MNWYQRYVVYHEAGHAVAALNSKFLDVGKIVFDEDSGHLEPIWRGGGEIEVSAASLLEKAMMTCAGGVAGSRFLEINGLPVEFKGHAAGLEDDLKKCCGCLEALAMDQRHANELITVSFQYFQREDVWNQVCLLAEHVSRHGLREISGDEVRTLLGKTLSSYGKGLPVPDHLLALGANNFASVRTRQHGSAPEAVGTVVGAAVGASAGMAGSVAAISAAGTAGLSGAGITSGLTVIGGSMLGGMAVLTGGVLLLAAGGAFLGYKYFSKR